ncbi:MAG: hypothetical protein ABFC90_12480 [Bacteroidales bacterium]
MKSIIKCSVVLLCMLLSIFSINGADTIAVQFKQINIRVFIKPPGNLSTVKLKLNLTEMLDRSGFPAEYFMTVPTVFCRDKVCRIDSIKLFWNNIGEYGQFELRPGVTLEKALGKDFSSEDYIKLQQILLDSDSPLKDVDLDMSDESVEGVDARTGATTMNENSTVKGALWTTYTLWHFAHGDIVSIIKNKTAEACDLNQLIVYLKTGNFNYKRFAIQQLKIKKLFDSVTLNEIETAVNANANLTLDAIDYIELAPPTVYFSEIQKLYTSGNERQRVMYLNSLSKLYTIIPEDFFVGLFEQSVQSKSYQEIDKLFNIIESKSLLFMSLNPTVVELLENENKLVARRAYWYLTTQKLNETQNKKLELFKKQNAFLF